MVIDYVVPMVFPDDAQWRRDIEVAGISHPERHVRWRSWGTERHLIRLVKKNMPFVRNVYVLLARKSQKRDWMDEYGVRVVYHKDFIPGRFLPLFNSRSIEMFLKDIPDLSENFLYGNDDMFPLSELSESDFFIDGKPCIKMDEKEYPEKPNNFQRACMCGLNFAAREFRAPFTDTWLKNGHSIAPILKSTCEHLWQVGGVDIIRSISKFREPYNFNQYIYSWWQYLSGNFVDKAPKRSYVSVHMPVEDIEKVMLAKGQGIVCVNDNGCAGSHDEYASSVLTILEKM